MFKLQTSVPMTLFVALLALASTAANGPSGPVTPSAVEISSIRWKRR